MSLLRTAAIALLAVAGCASGPAEPRPDAEGSTDSGAAIDSGTGCDPTLTYANFGAAFLSTHCNGCHGWTQSDVKAAGSALSSVVLGGFMPPGGGSLTQPQRQQFADWVACGAP
jgi:hypothetical protein